MKCIRVILISLGLVILSGCSTKEGADINNAENIKPGTQGSLQNTSEPSNEKVTVEYPVVSEGVYDISSILGYKEARDVEIYPEKNIIIFINVMEETAEIIPYDLELNTLYSEKAIKVDWKLRGGAKTLVIEGEDGLLIHTLQGPVLKEKAVYYDVKTYKTESTNLKFDLMANPLGYSGDFGFLYCNETTIFSYNIKSEEIKEIVTLDVASIDYVSIGKDVLAFSGQAYSNAKEQSKGVYGLATIDGAIKKLEYLPNSALTFDKGLVLREIETIENNSINTLGKFFVVNAESDEIQIVQTEDKNETLGNYAISSNASYLSTVSYDVGDEQVVIKIYNVKNNELIKKVDIKLTNGDVYSKSCTVLEEGAVLFSYGDESGTKTYKIVF